MVAFAPGGKFSFSEPYALALRYARELQGGRIADASTEEMARLGFGTESQRAAWDAQMRKIFPDVKPGTYAVKVFHDMNSDGKLNTSWVGWPQEPYGFSNDAPVNMGPPSFKLAAITVKEGAQTARIALR